MAPMSSAVRMIRSDRRNPAARARSSPGVRMMTAKDRPCSRTSSGSSAAATSVVRLTASPATRVTGTERIGVRLSGGAGSSRTLSRCVSDMAACQFALPIVREDALEECRAKNRVREPTFIVDGEFGKAFFQHRGEDADAGTRGFVALAVELDALHPAARRVFLQDVSAQVHRGERG